jgi:hypothetical protein
MSAGLRVYKQSSSGLADLMASPLVDLSPPPLPPGRFQLAVSKMPNTSHQEQDSF